MRQIQITDQAYDQVKLRADQAGFVSVDEYLSYILIGREFEMVDVANLDYMFTPERLAIVDASLSEIEEGKFYTSAEVESYFKTRFEA